MATKNPRINITLEPTLSSFMTALAKESHMSVANLARDLIIEALERREDRCLSAIAELRDVAGVKTVSHDDAWQ